MIRKKRISLSIIMMIVFILFTACSNKEDAQLTENSGSSNSKVEKTSDGEAKAIETEKAEINFPYELDGGNLVVNALFQSSVENPDCGNEYADDIASLEVVNQSGKYLESAQITLHTGDGTELYMVIEDVPANQKVWVFDNKNSSITNDVTCISINCKSDYLDEVPLMADQITVNTDETTVTLKNQSGETLNGLTVKCHCLFDGVYYGGLTYSYPVDELSPGGSAVIEADDCFLGTADVVRISKN